MCEPVSISLALGALATVGAGGVGAAAATAVGASATGLLATGAGLSTLGALGAGMAVGGGALSAMSSIQNGQFQNKMAKQQAAIEKIKAGQEIQAGEIEVDKQRREFQQQLGQGRAGYAAGNVLLEDAGSVGDWASSLVQSHQLDAAIIRDNARMGAWGYSVNASMLRAQGAMAERSGYMDAAGTILSTAGSVAGAFKPAGAAGGMSTTPRGAAPAGASFLTTPFT